MGVSVEPARVPTPELVDLTSTPDRVSANRLYQRLGFRHRETNVYRLRLTP